MGDYCSNPGKRSGDLVCVTEVRGHQKPAGLPYVWNVKFERKGGARSLSKDFDPSNCWNGVGIY